MSYELILRALSFRSDSVEVSVLLERSAASLGDDDQMFT
jgi:hypothetical protein